MKKKNSPFFPNFGTNMFGNNACIFTRQVNHGISNAEILPSAHCLSELGFQNQWYDIMVPFRKLFAFSELKELRQI